MHKVPVKQDEESREIHCITWYLCCCCCLVASVVSDSMRPHRGKPTRLPRPWDSLGKNTGVGRHFLLQCVKEKSESEVTQSCPTLSDPMDCSLSGSAIHGIFQARVLEWVPLPSPMVSIVNRNVWYTSKFMKVDLMLVVLTTIK